MKLNLKSFSFFYFILYIFLSFQNIQLYAQNDEFYLSYNQLKNQLDSGNLNIDYKKLKMYYCYSKNCLFRKEEYRSLEKHMKFNFSVQNYHMAARDAKRLLAMNYTDIFAHEVLWRYYKSIGDTIGLKKHKRIQEELLNIILKGGDGKSCESAFEIIQESDLLYILRYFGYRLVYKPNGFPGVYENCIEIKVKDSKTSMVLHLDVTLWLVKLRKCHVIPRRL